MSAYIQSYPYIFGKKKPGTPDLPVMSPERLAQIEKSVQKYLPKKPKK